MVIFLKNIFWYSFYLESAKNFGSYPQCKFEQLFQTKSREEIFQIKNMRQDKNQFLYASD